MLLSNRVDLTFPDHVLLCPG